jgi:chemotaxis protein CheD
MPAWRAHDYDASRLTALARKEEPEVYLYPGDISTAQAPRTMKTIVGSCVSVFLWDERRRQGGMNHYLLPERHRPADAAGRFGNTSIRLLLEKLVALGSAPHELSAKVFGGAHVLHNAPITRDHLGQQNVDIAFATLSEWGVQVVNCSVGGNRGRRVVATTSDGSAWVQEL